MKIVVGFIVLCLVCYVLLCVIISYIHVTYVINSPNVLPSYKKVIYMNISAYIRSKTGADIHLKGSLTYEKRRKVSNGLCQDIFPDLLVVPKSTKDVSEIVKISRQYNVSISIRSGGHSFKCTSTKPSNIKKYNKLELIGLEGLK